MSNDQQYIYAVDTDSNAVFVLDSRSMQVVSSVKVGNRPFRVAVGNDDTVFVANRGSRYVSVIHKGDWKEAAQIPTGVDPNGMQVSSDGKTLYVVSATALDSTDHGILQAFDTSSLQNKWTMAVGAEPRGLALVAGDRAVVSLYRVGDLQTIDLNEQKVVQASTDIFQQANKSALSTPLTTGTPSPSNPVTYSPRGIGEVAVSPSGDRVYAPGQLSRNAPILVPPSVTAPYYASQGPANAGSVTTSAVFTLGVANGGLDTSRVEDVSAVRAAVYCGTFTTEGGCGGGQPNTDAPQTSYAVAGYSGETILQGPTAAVVDMTGAWLFVVNRESSNLAIISTQSRTARQDDSSSANSPPSYYGYGSGNELPSVHSTATVGAGADGVAILGDNQTAFVYAQFDHKLTRLQLDGRSESLVNTGEAVTVDHELLAPDVAAGRRLFYDATNPEVSAPTASVACSSCHMEGLDDGQTWQFTDGPRNTPVLAGRGITKTAPFHWTGEFSDMNEFFTNVVTARMGGTGLTGNEAPQIEAFMDSLPAPENPYVGTQLNDAQQRGSAAFAKAGCGTCHLGQWMTDNAKHPEVNTANRTATADTNGDNGDFVNTGFNTPSLKGLARSAPYLHDGSIATLSDRVFNDPNPNHGNLTILSVQEKQDLVEYLKTL